MSDSAAPAGLSSQPLTRTADNRFMVQFYMSHKCKKGPPPGPKGEGGEGDNNTPQRRQTPGCHLNLKGRITSRQDHITPSGGDGAGATMT